MDTKITSGNILISDVSNLQVTLDGKAPSAHTHSIANLTDMALSLPNYAYFNGSTATNSRVCT